MARPITKETKGWVHLAFLIPKQLRTAFHHEALKRGTTASDILLKYVEKVTGESHENIGNDKQTD